MLTNEEKINLRERALRLAHEFPIENTGTYQSWADDIYDYLTKDIGLAEIPELEKSRQEIDWSWTNPRLVRSKADASVILETTGRHTPDMFEGIENAVGRRYGWFQKDEYRYHGEIPQEHQADGLNFLEAIKAAKRGKNIRRARNWAHGYFWYHSNDTMYDSDGDRIDSVNPSNVLATDWQIVE